MTLFKELYNYFHETYFSPDLTAIQNFETYDVQRFLPYLIVGLCVGTFIAICYSYYVGHYLGSVVRALYKANAFSPKDAKTLDELSLNKYLIRRNLYNSTVVSKYVKPAEEITSENDVKNASFYIIEEQKYIADKRFKEVKHGKLLILITFFVCVGGCFGLLLLVPEILQLADNVITITKG